MIRKVYVVRDAKASAFIGGLILSDNNLTAIRSFSAAVNNAESAMYHNPEDYAMFCIGEYDDVAGKLTGASQNVSIITALEVKKVHGESK